MMLGSNYKYILAIVIIIAFGIGFIVGSIATVKVFSVEAAKFIDVNESLIEDYMMAYRYHKYIP